MTSAKQVIDAHRAYRKQKLRARNSKRTAERVVRVAELARRGVVREHVVLNEARATLRARVSSFIVSVGGRVVLGLMLGALLWTLLTH